MGAASKRAARLATVLETWKRSASDYLKLKELFRYQVVRLAGTPLVGLAIQVTVAEAAEEGARRLQSCIPQQDAYEIIGVTRDTFPLSKVDQKKLKADALRKAHPDKDGDKDTFGCVKMALDVLMDPWRRRLYDLHGWAGGFRCQVGGRSRSGY